MMDKEHPDFDPGATARSPLFQFKTPRYRLETEGMQQAISVPNWDGAPVAEAMSAAFDTARRSGHSHPILVGAVPFDSRQPAHLYIPEKVTWHEAGAPQESPAPVARTPIRLLGEDSPAYRAAVAKARRRISLGVVDKVVLARRVVAEAQTPFDVAAIYQRLCAMNTGAFVYQLDLPPVGTADHSPVLLGASPELVLGSSAGAVESVPLAGSIPRLKDAESDHRLGLGLLQSQKDLHEHAIVVHAVAEQFRLHCAPVSIPATPDLVQTPVIWHLGSRISGTLRAGVNPMQLAYALHPTPAVSGWPQKAAQRSIAELEGFDRGYYAGLIGWMDAEGNGEWALALRCGVIDGTRAQVYAGAGIVAESDPEKEHAETAAKLRTFLIALGSVESSIAA